MRERLRIAPAKGRKAVDRLRELARREAGEIDARVRSHPDESVGIAVGVGAADRLEWRLQARRFGRRRMTPPPWLLSALRPGLAGLPRGRTAGGVLGPGWTPPFRAG